MINQIVNLVEKTEFVELERLKPFQPDNLKTMTSESFEMLKESIIKNNFIAGFYVWDDGKTLWIIDGHHRKYALQELKKEGVLIPDKYLCIFLKFEDKQQAAQALLTYGSNHAKVHPEGFMEYAHQYGLNLQLLSQTLDIPGLNIQKLNSDVLSMEDEPETNEKPKFFVLVDCKNEPAQRKLLIELEERGYECKAKI